MDTTGTPTGGRAMPDSTKGVTARRWWRDRSWWNRPRTVVVAAVLTGSLVYLAGMLLGVDPQVRAGSGTVEVTVGLVIAASMTTALAGWGVRALLLRTRSGGRRAWLVLSAVVLLVSLLGPLGAANGGAMLLLMLEHLTVGAVVALGLSRAGRRASTAGRTPAAPRA